MRPPVIREVEEAGQWSGSFRYLTLEPVSLGRVAIGVWVGAVLLTMARQQQLFGAAQIRAIVDAHQRIR